MGVVKPPWITYEWFRQCPFNYCDHFGNKQRLAEVCKICKDELEYEARCLVEGKDPNDWGEVFKLIGENLAKAMQLIQEEADRMGIDLSKGDDDFEDPPPAKNYPIYELVNKYGNSVERMMNNLSIVPKDVDMDLFSKALATFSHSRYYVVAKTSRALSGRWREERDPIIDSDDAKTSALLAYIAVERNSRAALALAHHRPLSDLKIKHLKFAKLSLETASIIKQHFFSNYKFAYKEFGSEEFDDCFNQYLILNSKRI